uniref:hypothetical protein n=1 Tax=Prevotella jejuni TaxID=1177574 RepID=UPI003C770A6C
SAAHREQQPANGQTGGGSKPKGVVGKSRRKAPEAVSYRAKVQRQPICPDKVESCGWREKSCGGDSSLHPQDSTFQGRQAAVVPLHDKKRHQGICVCLCLQRLRACFLRLSDRWQIIALNEQHYRAC